MTDRDGQRVGHIIGFGCLFKHEELGHHKLDLLLLRRTVTHDSPLDLGGGVLLPRQRTLADAAKHHPESAGDLNRGRFVGGKEQPLGRDGIGLPLIQIRVERFLHEQETIGGRHLRRRDEVMVHLNEA